MKNVKIENGVIKAFSMPLGKEKDLSQVIRDFMTVIGSGETVLWDVISNYDSTVEIIPKSLSGVTKTFYRFFGRGLFTDTLKELVTLHASK